MFLMWTGNEFQAAGPATVNKLSASRVLVSRTTKLPRVDDRRRWSLQRLHRSVRYSGAVPWKTTSNIKTHNLYVIRLATGSQCNDLSLHECNIWSYCTVSNALTYTFSHVTPLLRRLHWLPVARRITYKLWVLMSTSSMARRLTIWPICAVAAVTSVSGHQHAAISLCDGQGHDLPTVRSLSQVQLPGTHCQSTSGTFSRTRPSVVI